MLILKNMFDVFSTMSLVANGSCVSVIYDVSQVLMS